MATQTKKAKTKSSKAKQGRPKGAKNKPAAPVSIVEPSRCISCGSTERTPYRQPREMEHSGENAGLQYSHIVWRRTSCKGCGQHRVDKSHELRPSA